MKKNFHIKPKLKRRLFTLVEVMIASFVMATAMLTLYSSMIYSRRAVYIDRFKEEAHRVAMDKALEIKQLPYNELLKAANTITEESLEEDLIFAKNKSDSSNVYYNSSLTTFVPLLRTAIYENSNSCEIQVQVLWTCITPSGTATKTDIQTITVFRYKSED